MYALTLVTAPAEEPVDIDVAKLWLKVEPSQTEDDQLIQDLIKELRTRMEAEYNCAMVTQTWKMFLDQFPCAYFDSFWGTYARYGAIKLPKSPLVSVTHVKYYDTADAQQTLVANTDYIVDAASQPGQIALAYGKSWPSVRSKPNAIEIQFVCGFGAASAVDPMLLRELRVRLAHAYDNRGIDEPAQNNFVYGRWPERRINV